MGVGSSIAVEQVKTESFKDNGMTNETFLIFNFHTASGFGGALFVIAVLGLGCAGYGLARLKDRRKELVRRAGTTLMVIKSPV